MKATTAKSNLKDKIRNAQQYLQKIRTLMQEVDIYNCFQFEENY